MKDDDETQDLDMADDDETRDLDMAEMSDLDSDISECLGYLEVDSTDNDVPNMGE